MTDRELLEAAAKASGLEYTTTEDHDRLMVRGADMLRRPWNPLADDGDALRLAVKLRIDFYVSNMNGLSERTEENAVVCHSYNPANPRSALVSLSEPFGNDPCAATRRALVRAAAAMKPAQQEPK